MTSTRRDRRAPPSERKSSHMNLRLDSCHYQTSELTYKVMCIRYFQGSQGLNCNVFLCVNFQLLSFIFHLYCLWFLQSWIKLLANFALVIFRTICTKTWIIWRLMQKTSKIQNMVIFWISFTLQNSSIFYLFSKIMSIVSQYSSLYGNPDLSSYSFRFPYFELKFHQKRSNVQSYYGYYSHLHY